MLTGRGLLGGAVLIGLASTLFVACAKGNTDLGGIGGAGGGAGTGSHHASAGAGAHDGGKPGDIGSVCRTDADCRQGTCTSVGGAMYCTTHCPPACPQGSYCSIINGDTICVPDLDQECLECTGDTDCKLPTDVCLTAPAGDKFCARDCTTDGLCPNGFTCLDRSTYSGADAGTDGGSMGTGGSTGSGDSGATGGGDGGLPPAGMPDKWCVPNGGQSCPCNQKRDGIVHACSVTNASGTCSGMETCKGSAAAWQGCTAQTPSVEVCNGKDDNCNGQIDEGDPNALCAAMGPKPANGSWGCMAGTCALGSCDPGWTAYPPGLPGAGCTCPVEMSEPNGTCAQAANAGMVSDVGGAPLIIQGTLSSAVDVDFWAFNTTDIDEMTTNSYHVSISFTQPTPNDEFVMDVIRGDPCVEAPSGAGVQVTSYDWCVNATGAMIGEAACGPLAATHCTDHSSKYYVRVYRKLGATPTCSHYQITVTGGGGTCDLTQKCP